MDVQQSVRRGLECARHIAHSRTVVMTTDTSRGGNLLYTWAWAHAESRAGRPTRVLENSHCAAWLEEFPELRALTIPRQELKILDARHVEALYNYGDPLGHEQLVSFVNARLLHSPRFSARMQRARQELGAEALVINVRRGDYYSNPEFRKRYGIDIKGHVREALALLGHSPTERPHAFVVSDDVGWCEDNLSELINVHRVFRGEQHSMFNDLAALACAKQLVLANSTFSYWGQFISRSLKGSQRAVATAAHEYYPDKKKMVIAPLDPSWLRTSATPGAYN